MQEHNPHRSALLVIGRRGKAERQTRQQRSAAAAAIQGKNIPLTCMKRLGLASSKIDIVFL